MNKGVASEMGIISGATSYICGSEDIAHDKGFILTGMQFGGRRKTCAFPIVWRIGFRKSVRSGNGQNMLPDFPVIGMCNLCMKLQNHALIVFPIGRKRDIVRKMEIPEHFLCFGRYDFSGAAAADDTERKAHWRSHPSCYSSRSLISMPVSRGTPKFRANISHLHRKI